MATQLPHYDQGVHFISCWNWSCQLYPSVGITTCLCWWLHSRAYKGVPSLKSNPYWMSCRWQEHRVSLCASVHQSEGLSTWRPLPSPDSFFPQYSNGWLCPTYLHTISKTPGWRPKTQVSHRHQLSEGISISARIQRSNMIWSPNCLVPISYQEFEQWQTIWHLQNPCLGLWVDAPWCLEC